MIAALHIEAGDGHRVRCGILGGRSRRRGSLGSGLLISQDEGAGEGEDFAAELGRDGEEGTDDMEIDAGEMILIGQLPDELISRIGIHIAFAGAEPLFGDMEFRADGNDVALLDWISTIFDG